MITEENIGTVFSERAIAELARECKLPPNVDLALLRQNICDDVQYYCAENVRTNWKVIKNQIEKLHGLLQKAEFGREIDAIRLADCLSSITPPTRQWLDRSLHLNLSFPSSGEIRGGATRTDALIRLRRFLCYGSEKVEGRKRRNGQRSRSNKPWLRSPPLTRGAPRDLAARELVQRLAVTWLEAKGKSPPSSVWYDLDPPPFFVFVCNIFERAGLDKGYVEDLINERGDHRKIMKVFKGDDPPCTMGETGKAFEKRHLWRKTHEIHDQIKELETCRRRLESNPGNESALTRLIKHLKQIDPQTRQWVAHCARHPLVFPSGAELCNPATRPEAMLQLERVLSEIRPALLNTIAELRLALSS